MGQSALRLRLAPGIRLEGEARPASAVLCVDAKGDVPLNQHALAILELCDGTRSRDRVVLDAVLRSGGAIRATDVIEFLEAARGRGWLMETP
jgi:hypothetical protein